MRPTTPSSNYDLVVPVGIGTGLVEASSSLWKRAAESASIGLGDLVRWAFGECPAPLNYSRKVTGQLALNRRFRGIDGSHAVAEVYLGPLRNLVAAGRIEACTLLPFATFLSPCRLVREYRAWCPLCLASMLSGPGAYEPLLWRLGAVTVCPVHGVDLVTVCHVCMVPQQAVAGCFSRVGCCNRCGAWMGTEEAARGLRRADESEVRVSRAIMSLLAWTAEFENYGHDGRSTYKQLLRIRGVRHLLISEAGLSPELVRSYGHVLCTPRLEILATIAAVSRQPLHRVILGQLAPWSGGKIADIDISKISRKRDWAVLEREFELLADSETFIPLKNVCVKLKISWRGAKRHFPDLADRIVQRGKLIRSESLEATKRAMLESMRPAFRLIHASGEYPSVAKIIKLSGADMRKISKEYKRVIEEEWLRVGGRPILDGDDAP